MIYGIDIGGTKIELVVFDDALEALKLERVATPTGDYQQFIDAVADLVSNADAAFADAASRAAPIGVGIPGLVDENGLSFSANVPCAIGKPVARDLAARIGRPVVAENDCRLFAMSEAIGGAGNGHHSVFGAILGTGAAAGLVIDGKLERGRRGAAGEYGHLPLSASLQQTHGLALIDCGCGLPACAEAYIGGPGFLRMARHFGVAADCTHDVIQAWRAGDPAGQRSLEALLDILGASLANVVKLVDPDIIVMGGGLSKVPEVIAAIPNAITRHMFTGFGSPLVVEARFGDSSGVRGAAILARGNAG